MKDKRIWGVVGAVVFAVAGGSFFVGARADDVIVPAVTPVRTAVAELREFRDDILSSGFVRGVRQADVAPKINGSVVDLRVEEGEAVFAGQVLAIVDGAELSAARKRTLLSLEAARKTLSETKDYHDQKVKEAEAKRESAEEQYDDGDITREERDVAREAEKSAEKLRYAEIASAEAEIAAAEGSALVSETALSQATVRAPFSGVVIERHASLGSFVTPGLPIYTIVSPDQIEIRATVPGSYADRVSLGEPVRIVLESGEEVMGEVFSIARAVGETAQRSLVRIRLAETHDSRPLIGSYVEIFIPVGEPRMNVSVPEQAIIERYDDAFVLVFFDGIAEKRRVEVGESRDGRVEVVSGITEGERIIVEGQAHLRDGDVVSEPE